MPVPVLTSAFKINPQPTSCPSTTNIGVKSSVPTGKEVFPGGLCRESGENRTVDATEKNEEDMVARVNGGIVLRHYYIGAARAMCLESAVTAVPVTLTQVSKLQHTIFDSSWNSFSLFWVSSPL